MSLELVIESVKKLDGLIQKQYTRLGQKIPDEHLYKVTSVANILGVVGASNWGSYLSCPPYLVGLINGFILEADFVYNMEGLTGHIYKNIGESKAIDPVINFFHNYNKVVRLPIFLIGMGFLGKGVLDVANYVVNNEPLNNNTAMNIITGAGFLSSATSMYLKDQDPKSLKKSESRIKNLFVDLYRKAKESIHLPSPQPVPIKY